jgi:hypothetical protein
MISLARRLETGGQGDSMSKTWKSAMTLCGAVILTTVVASPSAAGCVDPPSLLSLQRARTPLLPVPGKRSAAFNGGQQSVGHDFDEDASIVGLWQFVFTSKGNDVVPFLIPDGAPLDSGYAQWHSDETEIMNSSRDPATSNFCLGTWKKIGNRTYTLNHFALSWDNTGKFCTPEGGAPSCFVGTANIREEVVLDRQGNSYAGTVTIDQYDTANNWMFRLTGTISAQRITAD